MKRRYLETAALIERLADAIERQSRSFDWRDTITRIQSDLVRLQHVTGSRLLARIGFALYVRMSVQRGPRSVPTTEGPPYLPIAPENVAELRALAEELRRKGAPPNASAATAARHITM